MISSMAEVEEKEDPTSEFLPNFPDVNSYTQNALKSVLQATKCSNELPATGDDFDYYSSFQGVRDVLDIEGKRILHIIQSVLKYQNVKGNLTENSDTVEVEDKFDVLIDANDQILERVGNWLDEASGVKKDDTTLVIATATPKHGATASWNKKSLKLPVFATDEVLESPEFQYPHPYQYEIEDLTPLEDTLSPVIPQMPKSLNETPVKFINKVSDLAELCETLRNSKEIAHHSYRTYQGVTCLMQISTREEDYLIDTLELRSDLYLLNDVFTDPSIVKVLHGAEMDICWLQRDFGLYIVNMFDTGQAARVLNFARFSLSHLLKLYCNVDADKQFQLADWRIRPLPEELIKYAREDTHYLLYIYDKMKNELIDRGNEQKNLLKSVIQRSKEVTLKIAEILPRERQGVFACCNPIPPLVRQYLIEIHDIVKESRETPLVKVETHKHVKQPSSHHHPKYDPDSMLNCPHDMSHQSDKAILFFPSESVSNGKDSPAISWKLLRNTVKRKEREPSPPSETTPVQEPPPKRQKLKGKAYGKKKTGYRFGMISDTSHTEAQSNKSQKRKLDNDEEDKLEEFTPYDYSKVDMKMFQELRQKGKTHKGHKLGSSKSKKSYYGGQGSSSHAWPKK
ncbi:hypothetical protein KUTeg_001458 [Tegillarca granosa]|uniref:3'-5' exonuclease domain-containing protein n=1 Tax=Tegillarca granosa TaxID=220873 RepID=A0ABQ9FUQ1_TEGGR|nr:hypothetical protein KUTeg_001458 [Tegillarca granosa]